MPRPRLLRLLSDHRVGLVFAPAGAGKTTLLAHYANGSDRSLWIALNEYDGQTDAFRERVESTSNEALRFHENGWVFLGPPTTIVVDDAHHLRKSTAAELLTALINDLPDNWRLAVAGRSIEGLQLSGFHTRNDLLMLTWDDLQFGLWEVDQLFRSYYGIDLRPGELAPLARNTGGWAAALHLFQVALRQRPARRQALIESLNSPEPRMRHYLMEQVFEGIDGPDLLLLAQIASFETIDAELISKRLGPTGLAVVERLHDHGLLTATQLPHRYYLHPLLRNHLLQHLVKVLGYEELADVYRLSAELLEAEGRSDAATRAYYRAGRFRDVERLGGAGLNTLSIEELRSLLANDQWGLWAQGVSELRAGSLENALAAFEDAASSFEQPPPQLRSLSSQISAWLEPPAVPVPAMPFGALRRWLAGDDAPASLLQTDRGLAGAIYRSVKETIATNSPASVDYRGTDRLAQLVADLVEAFLHHLIDGDNDCRALQEAETLLQTGVGCPALERIFLALSAPKSANEDDRQIDALVAHLRSEAERSNDGTGGELLNMIGRVRSNRPAIENLADSSFGRLVALNQAPAGTASTEAQPTNFAIRLIGEFALGAPKERTEPIPLRPQHLAVLQALALRASQWVPRDRLRDWFWPDAEAEAGNKRLATALSEIRKVLSALPEHAELERRAESYRLVLNGQTDLAYIVSRLRTAETESRRNLPSALLAMEQALDASDGALLPAAASAEWSADIRWNFSDRWERTVSAVLEASQLQSPDELLQLLPRLLTRAEGSDHLWQLAIAIAQDAEAPLLAKQLETRYHEMLQPHSNDVTTSEP